MACPSATTCFAVGSSPSGDGVVVPISNGVPGSPELVPGVPLRAVACISTTTCVAVGAEVVPITNGVPGTAVAGAGGSAIACSANTGAIVPVCFAVGGGRGVTTIDAENGSLLGPVQITDGDLYSVACSSTGICNAVGLGPCIDCNDTGFVVPLPYEEGYEYNVSGTPEGVLTSVTCPGPGDDCIAVGSAETTTGADEGIRSSGLQGAQFVPGTTDLNTVFCPSGTGCSALSGNSILNLSSGATSTPPISIAAVGCFTTCEAVGSDTSGEGAVMPLTPPTTTVALPSNGATLAGSLYLDAAASDNVGVTQVNYVLTGGTLNDQVISGSTPTYFGWIGSWDTTTVPNGTYTLQSVATDVEGFSTTSAPITITVNNQPPTTAVLLPSNGATLSGAQYLDASASSLAGIKSVSFEITGGTLNDQVISGSTPTYFGWIGSWDTTTVPNGTYTLQSVATDVEGFSRTSAPITVTVNNPPPTTTVALPSNGATVSGDVWLDASASAGVSQVQYEVTGGSLSASVIATATPTVVGWLAGWDTTTVPNGTYTLNSVASYAGGVTGTSPGVSITVDNLPLQTEVLVPSDGATVSGSTVLDAAASGTSDVTGVQFEVTGGSLSNQVVGTATPTLYGWIAKWDTTSVPDGSYTLQSVATEVGGTMATSPGIDITVSNGTAS